MNSSSYRRFIITGGTGYLGEAFVAAVLAAGHGICLLTSSEIRKSNIRQIPWRLGEALPRAALDPESAPSEHIIVHLAHDWRDTDPLRGRNLIGARVLRDGARNMGIGRIIFISSPSARPDALNAYGRIKWQVEQLFDAPDELSIRVGLVYGGPWKGQYGLLCRLAMITSILPMVHPHQNVQPIHRDEVACGILLAAGNSATGTLGLASPRPLAFSKFLDDLACRLRGGSLRLIPIPLGLALRFCSLTNMLPGPLKVDPERVLGLAGTRAIPTKNDLDRLGLEIISFADRMAREPAARRAVLQEGRTLIHYVLGNAPNSSQLRHYFRRVMVQGNEGAVRLPRLLHLIPWLLHFFEPVGRGRALLVNRLKLATALAASSPRFSRASVRGARFAWIVRSGAGLCLEIISLPIRFIATKCGNDK